MAYEQRSLIESAQPEVVRRLAGIESLSEDQRTRLLAVIEERIADTSHTRIIGQDNGIEWILQMIFALLSGQPLPERSAQQEDESTLNVAFTGVYEWMTHPSQDPEIREVATLVTGIRPSGGHELAAYRANQIGTPTMENSVIGAYHQAALELRASGVRDGRQSEGPNGTSPPVTTETVTPQPSSPDTPVHT